MVQSTQHTWVRMTVRIIFPCGNDCIQRCDCFQKDSEDDVFDPWCPSLRTELCNAIPSCFTRYDSFSTGLSPVSKKLVVPYESLAMIDASLVSHPVVSRSGYRISITIFFSASSTIRIPLRASIRSIFYLESSIEMLDMFAYYSTLQVRTLCRPCMYQVQKVIHQHDLHPDVSRSRHQSYHHQRVTLHSINLKSFCTTTINQDIDIIRRFYENCIALTNVEKSHFEFIAFRNRSRKCIRNNSNNCRKDNTGYDEYQLFFAYAILSLLYKIITHYIWNTSPQKHSPFRHSQEYQQKILKNI